MGWYSSPFNYDGTSPTQVRDDLQKANENFTALSDVFENGTPLSGKIKSSYIQGNITPTVDILNIKKINVNADTGQDYGISFRGSNGFSSGCILMPKSGTGTQITWGDPADANSLIGMQASTGRFVIIGHPNSSGVNEVYIQDKVVVAARSGQDCALNLRNSSGFSESAILMPQGSNGSYISWNPFPIANYSFGLIGIQNLTREFVIRGLPPWNSNTNSYDPTGTATVYMSDNLDISGDLVVHGNIVGNVTYTVPDTITLKKITLNANSGQDYGIRFNNSGNFTQSAIILPVGVGGSTIAWVPAYQGANPWGTDSLIGVNTSGQFRIRGRGDSSGNNKIVYIDDDVNISRDLIVGRDATIAGNLTVTGTINGGTPGGVPDPLDIKKINVNAASGQDYGIKFSGSFSQTAIWMPVGVYGSTVAWTPVNASWGADSLIGVNSSGQFYIIGRPTSAGGTKMIYMSDYVQINGDLKVTGNIIGNVTYQLPTTITCKKININADAGQDYGLSFRGSNGFSQGCILMPTSGIGTQISWSTSPDADTLIGVQNSTGNFVIIGKQDSNYGNKTVYMYDSVVIPQGKLVVNNILIYKDSSDGRAKIVGTPDSGNQGRNTLYVYSDFSAVGEAWVNGQIHVATSISTAGITFRDVADTCNYSEAAIWMPRYGNGNYISWNPYSIANYSYGIIGRQNSTGRFVIVGLPSGGAGSDAAVYMYDNVTVNKTLYATSVVQTCDLSLKENVVVLSDSVLDLVKKIDVYEYSLKSDPDVRHVGFIANYVKDVFPQGVTIHEQNEMCSINILDMLALLFKAVKELAEHVANN